MGIPDLGGSRSQDEEELAWRGSHGWLSEVGVRSKGSIYMLHQEKAGKDRKQEKEVTCLLWAALQVLRGQTG